MKNQVPEIAHYPPLLCKTLRWKITPSFPHHIDHTPLCSFLVWFRDAQEGSKTFKGIPFKKIVLRAHEWWKSLATEGGEILKMMKHFSGNVDFLQKMSKFWFKCKINSIREFHCLISKFIINSYHFGQKMQFFGDLSVKSGFK